MNELRLYQDEFAPHTRTAKDLRAQHGIAYVFSGSAGLGEQPLEADAADFWSDRRGGSERGRPS